MEGLWQPFFSSFLRMEENGDVTTPTAINIVVIEEIGTRRVEKELTKGFFIRGHTWRKNPHMKTILMKKKKKDRRRKLPA